MMTKKQINFTPKTISSWLTVIVVFATIVILIIVSLFLYNNFYQAITQTEEIFILREKVAIDTIDIKKFDLIIERLTKKTAPGEFKNIVSPFR